ncbi:putative glycosyl transferase [Scytonema sp. HK-05]|uniref:glycosyltransferase family 2 protein n=1 Tax=Scytonema sp. HK-05 TaxID=1137095 RepID=UPI0009379C6B|nr:glycosyltransferase [Scytonema sp. HK-05]OKH59085.1 glycosyl transferase [Scytonema sp. HK-05]BAY48729.1 putative glycosyl transferase [Scytonema sp. HK-05]
MSSTVTIGFIPREQFSLAAESLQRIFDYTHIPFKLIVVDCNTPKVYWQQIEQVLDGRSHVEVIHKNHYLTPNQCKNLVIQQAKDDFVCFIESDVIVEEGWLSQLMAACEEHPADVAIPRIIEGRLGETKLHWDPNLGQIHSVQTTDGVKYKILPFTDEQQLDKGSHRRTIELSGEAHCQLYRRSVFDQVAPFDEEVVYLDWIDSSLALYNAKIPVVFEPKSVVHFWHPFPPRRDDLDYFFMRWDLERAQQDLDRIPKKWNLVQVTADLDFAIERNRIGQLHASMEELKALIPAHKPFILVDEDWLNGNEIIEGFRTIPFTEHNGKYWGAPTDDDTAIREFDRLHQAGASAIVFLMHTFWWLEYYSGFHDYLRQKFPCVLQNERLIVFDLR